MNGAERRREDMLLPTLDDRRLARNPGSKVLMANRIRQQDKNQDGEAEGHLDALRPVTRRNHQDAYAT
jgi:hypothetical protein